MIYFIACREAGLVKIGYTKADAAYRLKQLQFASPFKLEILGVDDGDRKTERALHDRFRADHVRKEWFRLSPDISAHIESVGGLERYHRAAKTYIRDLVGGNAIKLWSAAQRSAWRDFKHQKLSRDFNSWREHMGNLSDGDEALILGFLEAHGLLTGVSPSSFVKLEAAE